MTKDQLSNMIADRLNHLADQIAVLHTHGMVEEIELLRAEGLSLAAAFDNGEDFLYIGKVR